MHFATRNARNKSVVVPEADDDLGFLPVPGCPHLKAAYLSVGFRVPMGCKRHSLTAMAKVLSIPLDPTVLRQGYLAGRRGSTGDDNPYQVGTREGLAWGIGWAKGQEKQLRVVDGGCSPSAGSRRAKARFRPSASFTSS
jgi:hypothetical protein